MSMEQPSVLLAVMHPAGGQYHAQGSFHAHGFQSAVPMAAGWTAAPR
jgi:hypothetical protein